MPRRGIDLSEEQWRRVKGHAATRGQTLSEYVSDLVDATLGDGTPQPATKMAEQLIETSLVHVKDEAAHKAAGGGMITKVEPRPFTPAPKPKTKR